MKSALPLPVLISHAAIFWFYFKPSLGIMMTQKQLYCCLHSNHNCIMLKQYSEHKYFLAQLISFLCEKLASINSERFISHL